MLPNPIRYKPTGMSGYVTSRSARIYKIMVRRGIVIPEYEKVMDELAEEPVGDREDLNEQSGSQEDVGGMSHAVDKGEEMGKNGGL